MAWVGPYEAGVVAWFLGGSAAENRGDTVVWGSADDSAAKAEALALILQRKASVYDVSVPDLPTTSS